MEVEGSEERDIVGLGFAELDCSLGTGVEIRGERSTVELCIRGFAELDCSLGTEAEGREERAALDVSM